MYCTAAAELPLFHVTGDMCHAYMSQRRVLGLYSVSLFAVAYSTNRLVFSWRLEAPVSMNSQLQLPQFTVDSIDTADCTGDNKFNEGK